jgi:hypothetical protein
MRRLAMKGSRKMGEFAGALISPGDGAGAFS